MGAFRTNFGRSWDFVFLIGHFGTLMGPLGSTTRYIIAGNEVNKYVALIQGLLDEGTPISGIGVQGHFGGQTINIGKVQGIIETLGQFSLPIWVTEFDWPGNSNDYRLMLAKDNII